MKLLFEKREARGIEWVLSLEWMVLFRAWRLAVLGWVLGFSVNMRHQLGHDENAASDT